MTNKYLEKIAQVTLVEAGALGAVGGGAAAHKDRRVAGAAHGTYGGLAGALGGVVSHGFSGKGRLPTHMGLGALAGGALAGRYGTRPKPESEDEQKR